MRENLIEAIVKELERLNDKQIEMIYKFVVKLERK